MAKKEKIFQPSKYNKIKSKAKENVLSDMEI